ncbi:MAG TPA: hypothetical protein VL334_03605 [Anaerolineae bacterium]|nr:hypothetical protein [Anaerolineae bacterium]
MSTSEPSLSFNTFVREVLDALEAANVTYLIGGAVALAAWGETRTTRDLDLVIELPVESMGALSLELERRNMLVPVDIMLDLLIEDRADLPINAIHMTSGYKAEMFLFKPGDALRESSLQRRRLVDLGPTLGEVYVHSPEDLILNKLRFYRISQQTKHVRDIASIVLYQADALDMAYIERWVQTLNLADEWQEIQQRIVDL